MKKNIYPIFADDLCLAAWLVILASLLFAQITFATTRTWNGGVSGYWGEGGGSLTISENDTTGWGLTLNCQVNLNGNNLSID